MLLTAWGVINKVLKRSLHSDRVMSPASNPHKTALAPSLLNPWSLCSDFNPFYSLCAMLCSVMSDCDPMDCSLPGSNVLGIFPGKNTGVGCHFLFQGIFLTQDQNHNSSFSCIVRHIIYHCTTWEAHQPLQFSSVQSLSHVRLFETP